MSVVLYTIGPLLTNSGRASTRRECYEKKDAFFQCLDKNKNDTEPCEVEAKGYQTGCSASWIRYFNEQRWKALALKGDIKAPNTKDQGAHFEGKAASPKA